MISKASREIAEASGNLKKIRGNLISEEISKKVDISEQIAIIMNSLDIVFKELQLITTIDARPKEFVEQQHLRSEIKAEIDGKIENV